MNYIKEIISLNKILKKNNPIDKEDIESPHRKLIFIKSKIRNSVQNIILIILGTLAATIGFNGFLVPNGYIDGGVAGISLILLNLTSLPFGILLVLTSAPFILMGLFKLKLKSIFRSIFSVSLLAILVQIIHIPTLTEDKLLIATFGGLFLGLGSGLAIRGGAIIDATELLALVVTKKINISIGDFILIFNLFVFSAAAYLLSLEIAMYAILTYVIATKTIDFILDGIEEYTEVTIISDFSEDIRRAISEELGKGVTIFKGKGGYSLNQSELKDRDILYSVITRLEVSNIMGIISSLDPKAFVITNSVKDIKGGNVKTKIYQKFQKS